MIFPQLFFLREDDQLLVTSFTRRFVVNGPSRYIARPFERVKRRQAITLQPTHYMRVRDDLTGEVKNVYGPTLYFLGATEIIVERLEAITLRVGEYVKIVDKNTGVVRMERGEQTVYLNPTEATDTEVDEGYPIDDEQVVLVRDTRDGQLSLITEPQLFFPSATQEDVQVQRRIRLEDHQVMIIKGKDGQYQFRRGTDAERTFFLQPYTHTLEMYWSSGLHKDKRTLRIITIDLRPKFMWYEFEALSQDNVELIIGLSFFWQIVDVEQMVKTTDDPTGDICSHARSIILQAVSKVTLEQFLAEFNAIVYNAVLGKEDRFYRDRGSVVHAIEVRSVACKDPDTQQILQEIIQETTNRINRLQKQISENEVNLKRVQGDIEYETQRTALVNIQRDLSRIEATIAGEAEAAKVQAFLANAAGEVSLEDKLVLYKLLRKSDSLYHLSKSSAHLYFTPADINLSIESEG